VLLVALSSGADTPAFGFGCRGCNSCGGCYSSCGGGLFRKGCHGCCGGCHGYYGGCCGYYVSCHGCCGGYVACHGCGGGCHGMPMPPKEMPKPKKDGEGKEVAAPATIIVTLPADAKLTVDDNPTTSTSTTRVLVSPDLEPGKEFNYTLKGEIVRDGKTVVATQRITVRAGEETRVNLEFPTASVAQR
jgi:uncharacterized protein (TIGR03000 family)